MDHLCGLDDKELCAWLRENSSGIYRPAREAAGRIEALLTENARLRKALGTINAELAIDNDVDMAIFHAREALEYVR